MTLLLLKIPRKDTILNVEEMATHETIIAEDTSKG